MRGAWLSVLAACVCVSMWYPAGATLPGSSRCVCSGKAHYCVRDSLGLRCENCRDNSEGRHCENCREGFYHQGSGEPCLPCNCNSAGSVGPGCDSRGHCVCKPGVHGLQCGRCADGASVSAQGCGSQRSTCFCNGHSRDCSSAQGFEVYNISSFFNTGTEGWSPVTVQTTNPHFRWSPEHQDVEVISKDVRPVYLSAPAKYLGNQVLSYGQNFSFSLRLDRGVRHPSPSDVVLEGAGQKVSAALGGLRMVVPCGKKITYTFRLDEQPGSKWKPQLSSTEFQTLLSDLTAIKIRTTFGENGRGYLDNVALVSARLGSGVPAGWVHECRCPAGYEGQFCQFCAAGFKRSIPGRGRSSTCEPCSCWAGNCDPETGDCFSADGANYRQPCPSGYYDNPREPGTCLRCPCPPGRTCLVTPGTLDVICNCPPGTIGSRCQTCDEGFYGDPLGGQPCRRCDCNGHLDLNALGSCEPTTGRCLRCLNHTTGFSCEKCVYGYYHSKPTDACQACGCDPQGSVSPSCSDQGRCSCKEGFEGLKCERSSCPSCFNPVKSQVEKFELELKQLEALLSRAWTGGVLDVNAMEKTISGAEEMVQSMQKNADTLRDTESRLYSELERFSSSHSQQKASLQGVSNKVDSIARQDQQYKKDVAEIQRLIKTITQNLQKAKEETAVIEIPLQDKELGNSTLTSLVFKAQDLAKQHQSEAGGVEQTASDSLSAAQSALNQAGLVASKENTLRDEISSLRKRYETDVGLVKDMQVQTALANSSALAESKVALDTLKLLSDLEKNLTAAPQTNISDLVAGLDDLKASFMANVLSYEDLQKEVLVNWTEAEELLNKIRSGQQVQDRLLARANAAKTQADQAAKLFQGLDGVDQALDKLRGYEGQINSSRALADEALSKLPTINRTIQEAKASNNQSQAVLRDQGDYQAALDTLGKLNTTLSQMEKMSDSLPSSSNLLTQATGLRRNAVALSRQMESTTEDLNRADIDSAYNGRQAEAASQEAAAARKRAEVAAGTMNETLNTVNNLLSLLGKPGSVDERRVEDLERAVVDGRRRVETELRPRLRELENREAQQRADMERMINDINTILADVENLRQIRANIPLGCYNTAPQERP